VAAYFTASGSGAPSIYAHALMRRGEPWASLEARTVADLIKRDPVHVRRETTFGVLVDYFHRHRHNFVYVTDAEDRFLGAVSLHDIKAHLGEDAIADLLIASELLHDDMPLVTETDSLPHALERFLRFDGDRLPVVNDLQERRLVGSLTKNDLLLSLAEVRG